MSTVAEIEQAIQRLPPDDYRKLEGWWDQHREQVWDEQLAADSRPEGRLAGLLSEVDADFDAGRVTNFPR